MKTMTWKITREDRTAVLYEESAYAGVKRVAAVFAQDICDCIGEKPFCGTPAEAAAAGKTRKIAVMTLGASAWAEELPECKAVAGKREV